MNRLESRGSTRTYQQTTMKKNKRPAKGEKDAPVTVEELTTLIVTVVDAYLKKQKEREAPKAGPLDNFTWHPTPHCPGCRCSDGQHPNLPCTCLNGWWGTQPPPPCHRHGQATPITGTWTTAG